MRIDAPEEVRTTGTPSAGEDKRLRIKAIKERDKECWVRHQ